MGETIRKRITHVNTKAHNLLRAVCFPLVADCWMGVGAALTSGSRPGASVMLGCAAGVDCTTGRAGIIYGYVFSDSLCDYMYLYYI